MKASGIHGSEAQIEALIRASQRATIAGVFADLLKDAPAILKEQQNIRNTRPDMAKHMAAVDPAAKIIQFQAVMTNLATALGMEVMGQAMGVLDQITKAVTALGNAVEAHPTISLVLFDVALGIGALASALGILSTGFRLPVGVRPFSPGTHTEQQRQQELAYAASVFQSSKSRKWICHHSLLF